MRCPDCNKFVPYNTEEEPEVDSEEVSETTFTCSIRRGLTCGECGTDLKENTFEVEKDFADQIDKEHAKCTKDDDGNDAEGEHEFEVEEVTVEPTTGVIDTDRNGKKIKSARYMKTTYGFEGNVVIKCSKCEHTIEFEISDEESASSFEELT